MSSLSAATTATGTAAAPPTGCVAPPLAAKRRGNPTLHLAPAQHARGKPCPTRACHRACPGGALVPGVDPRGARTHADCPCQAPAIHGELRCRLHGGRSTGPRTPEGRTNIRAARTIHGGCGATARAKNRHRITLLCRTRVTVAADRTLDFLPAEFVARLHHCPPELMPPHMPTGGITAAQDQTRRCAVALAPWRQAIAAAREAARPPANRPPPTPPTRRHASVPAAPGHAARRRRRSSPRFWQNSLHQSAPPPRPTPA